VNLSWINFLVFNEVLFSPAADPFITKDKFFEKEKKCSVSESLARAKRGPPLLEGKQFFVTPNVQPEPSDMSDIIKCAGGEVGGASMVM